MNDDLFLAILAMDAYNRGYQRSIEIEGNQIGDATIFDDTNTDAAITAGFYGVAYGLGNGEKVISYRGTDSLGTTTPLTDIWNGWTVGLGFTNAAQVQLAIDFYEGVTGQSIADGAAGDITLTGHSLGGGEGNDHLFAFGGVRSATSESPWATGLGRTDPLVLDLDGDGFELTGLNSISPNFDIDNDLYAEQTAFVTGDDGLLARDINGEGILLFPASDGIASRCAVNDNEAKTERIAV